jgi:hypothetical protein
MPGWGLMSCESCRNYEIERALEETGGRSQPGSADPAGDRVKKAVTPGLRRKLGSGAQQTFQIGRRRAARLVRVAGTSWLYKKKVRLFDAVLGRC